MKAAFETAKDALDEAKEAVANLKGARAEAEKAEAELAPSALYHLRPPLWHPPSALGPPSSDFTE